MPDLVKDLGYDKAEVEAPKDKRECYDFRGGEDAGMKRVKEYIWESKAVGNYAATRNQLIGSNYSSKLSPWLATGNISPRYVYFETKAFEEKHRRNDSTKVYVDELFWRDYNRYWCLKYGNKVFSSYGIYDRTYYDWKTSPDFVKRWREESALGCPFNSPRFPLFDSDVDSSYCFLHSLVCRLRLRAAFAQPVCSC